MSLPDFLVLGAPKCGTTALHVALAAHPELYLSRNKEPKFFLTDGTQPPQTGGPGDAATYARYVWRREDYEQLFSGAPPGTLAGESTTLYLRDPAAHRRIAATVPDAKLIAVLRDPVDRAHSNWTHQRSAGLEPVGDFLEACALTQRRAEAGWGPFWRYLELGLYGAQLQHLFSVVPCENVLVLLYRDLREAPVATLDRVTTFLGVTPGLVTDIPSANVTAQVSPSRANRTLAAAVRRADGLGSRLPRPLGRTVSASTDRLSRRLQREQQVRAPLTADQRAVVIPYFLEDIELLEQLTGLELAHWRDPRNGAARSTLRTTAKFGTAYESIDSPTGLC